MSLSTGRILSEIQGHHKTRELWLGMDTPRKEACLARLMSCEDFKSLLRGLKKFTNRERAERAARRKAELDLRLTEFRTSTPSDSHLQDIRIEILGVADDTETLPMKRARKLWQLIAQYDRCMQQGERYANTK
jgi:hypothetical protein